MSSKLGPDGSLPSENELAGPYTHVTADRTARPSSSLQAEGLIYGKQGKGWFVRPKPHVRMLVTGSNYRRHRALNVPGFNAQALEQGMSPRQDITEVGRITAPPHVAHRLDLDEGSSVLVRRRVFPP